MAKKKEKEKNKIVPILLILVLIIFGVLIANSMMNGELLKNLKAADERKAEQSKEIQKKENENKEIDDEEEKEDEVFTKKEDETAFKLVDTTTDDETQNETTNSTQNEEERVALAISVVKREWYDGDEPEETDVYFNVADKKSNNIYTVEVRDKKTTRIKSTYDVNIAKKEIVNTF